MRIGLAGVGRIGAFHAETLKDVADVDSLVLSDAVPGRARDIAEGLGVESVESPEALFGAGIDGLVIAAATSAHAAPPKRLVRGLVDVDPHERSDRGSKQDQRAAGLRAQKHP